MKKILVLLNVIFINWITHPSALAAVYLDDGQSHTVLTLLI